MEMTTHKAWTALAASIVLPYVLQNLFGDTRSAGVVFDWLICLPVGSVCPDPNSVAGGIKSIVAAVVGGVGTGLLTWYVANKPKDVIVSMQTRG